MKVLAFPFAGGNKYSFDFLRPNLNQKIQFKVLEYAGRGERISEKPMESIDSIVDDLWQSTLNFIKDTPYIIYGHSMGALIAFLMCHQIQKKGLKKPSKLIVSGRKPFYPEKKEKIWCYPSEQFWNELISLGGIPEEIQQETSLREFFEPIIRADFKAVEEYFHGRMHTLDIPIEVLYGDEELDGEDDYLGWNKKTTNTVNFYPFKGNHFFIHNHAQVIANHFI
ncbi:surfactin synthase thioesterase subunit [Nonlabens dokdonensis]|jgi:surfactin synthase thioesterase subunit|uniref:Thioesterase n=2 Tax=Nonlabens dokdonensis TaxID=328515 RepID=L7W8U9_NONDD|nr:thioesterase domain-containing protein [Nonlabens dokdonensis]AGC75273.1 thioesterase [Nonlabens dokdonensis DSW-6]PZX38990.1 surfactin synthase thioesterase subunit [Nonlabens dokdonensis]